MVIWSVNLAQSTTSIFSDDSWSLTTVRCKLKLAQLFYWPAKQALVWLQYVFADSPVELWEYRLLIELLAKATNGLEIALWSDFTERQLDDISKISFSLFYLSKLLETEQCRKGKDRLSGMSPRISSNIFYSTRLSQVLVNFVALKQSEKICIVS